MKEITEDSLVGCYYQGDGKGYNLHLELKPDGSFTCTWAGCLGNYGSTSGSWRHQENRIIVKATESSGMFEEEPLGDMTILVCEGMNRLLLDMDADLLNDHDMLPHVTFGRIEPSDGRTKR